MEEGRPSTTAMIAAMIGAAHLLWDDAPKILQDPLALGLSGVESASALQATLKAMQAEQARRSTPEFAQVLYRYNYAGVIEAIRRRRTPPFERDDERLIYDIVTELSTTKTLGQASYDGLVASFGLERTIELMTTTSFYTMVAMMLNAFDAPVPGNARPLP